MGFVYEHISVEERAQIGLVSSAFRGSYGLVTHLARELGTSRKFIYGLAEKARRAAVEAMRPTPPGPKAPSRTLVLDRTVLERGILALAMVGRVSERAIPACLAELYQLSPSLGYVSGVLGRASEAARAFNDSLRFDLRDAQVEADELFACSMAHLLALEHSSMLILSMSQAERCDGRAWKERFQELETKGVKMSRLGSDGGTAIGAAASELAGVEPQLDRFHALRKVARVLHGLEQKAYKAISKEEEFSRKAAPMDRSHPMGGYVHDRAGELRRQAEAEIGRYDAMRILKGWVAEALEAIEERSGRLRGRAECLSELEAATGLMRELGGEAARKLADYLDRSGSSLLAYADQLALPIAWLARELGGEGLRLLSREWLLAKRLRHSRRTEDRRVHLRARLLALLHFRDGYKEARGKLFSLLDSTMRGSSLAECINSLLRPYAEITRGLGKGFLSLFQLYRNAHIFARGKRAGYSPFQLAGIQTPEGNWLDWLGLARQRASNAPVRLPATIRSLPLAA